MNSLTSMENTDIEHMESIRESMNSLTSMEHMESIIESMNANGFHAFIDVHGTHTDMHHIREINGIHGVMDSVEVVVFIDTLAINGLH